MEDDSPNELEIVEMEASEENRYRNRLDYIRRRMQQLQKRMDNLNLEYETLSEEKKEIKDRLRLLYK